MLIGCAGVEDIIVSQPICHSLRPCAYGGQFRTLAHVKSVAALRIDVHLYRDVRGTVILEQLHNGF